MALCQDRAIDAPDSDCREDVAEAQLALDWANRLNSVKRFAGANIMAVDAVLPKQVNGRELLEEAGRLRAAHPIACIENCATENEINYLWRYFEASDFAAGLVRVYDDAGEPMGRYAAFAERIDPQAYIKFEVAAYQWVRRYSLGREWATIATMFERMMRGEAETSFVDWGGYLTDADDPKISYGGAVISMRMLALRLKDSYRDFFRFYEGVRKADAIKGGAKASSREVLREIERDDMYRAWIEDFKSDRGVPG